MDNIVGIVYAKDLLNISNGDAPPNVRKFMRPAVFIPEYKPVDDLATNETIKAPYGHCC